MSAGNKDVLFSQKYGPGIHNINDESVSLFVVWIFESPNLLHNSGTEMIARFNENTCVEWFQFSQ